MRRVVRGPSPELISVGDASTEYSFRLLDEVFLETQTRIWLGEVLHIRFDEETAVADLLSDGELLFQVSKVVWKMVLKKQVELNHSKAHIYERTSSGKSDGKYMPYPKVDSFLKICQILGLTGIDLFSPSDVVEKRNVRRVCMCIRSLSKKARSKKLDIPDFDIVTYTIAMSNDLVGSIRRNLEQSQCSSSSSNGGSPHTESREIYRLKSFDRDHTRPYDLYSESEAEISSDFELQSRPSIGSCDAANLSHIVEELSSTENSIFEENPSEIQSEHQMDSQDQDKNEVENKFFDKTIDCEATLEYASKDKVDTDYCTGNSLDISHVHTLKEVEQFNVNLEGPAEDVSVSEESKHTSIPIMKNEYRASFTPKSSSSVGIESDDDDRSLASGTDSSPIFDSSLFDCFKCDTESMNSWMQTVNSIGSLSSSADKKQISLAVSDDAQLDSDCYNLAHKNDSALSLCDPQTPQSKNQKSISMKADDCDVNETELTFSPASCPSYIVRNMKEECFYDSDPVMQKEDVPSLDPEADSDEQWQDSSTSDLIISNSLPVGASESYWSIKDCLKNETRSNFDFDDDCLPQGKLQQTVVDASEKLTFVMAEDSAEEESSVILGFDSNCVTHGLETEWRIRADSNGDPNVLDGTQITVIYNVNLEDGHVNRDSLSNPGNKSLENNMQTQLCAHPAKQGIKNHEHDLTGAKHEKARDNGEREKDIAIHIEELKSSGKKELRRPGNKVLKSVAGGITVLGAMFFLLQLRQRRGKERESKTDRQVQTSRRSQEGSSKKRVEIGNTGSSLYPAERLRF